VSKRPQPNEPIAGQSRDLIVIIIGVITIRVPRAVRVLLLRLPVTTTLITRQLWREIETNGWAERKFIT